MTINCVYKLIFTWLPGSSEHFVTPFNSSKQVDAVDANPRQRLYAN